MTLTNARATITGQAEDVYDVSVSAQLEADELSEPRPFSFYVSKEDLAATNDVAAYLAGRLFAETQRFATTVAADLAFRAAPTTYETVVAAAAAGLVVALPVDAQIQPQKVTFAPAPMEATPTVQAEPTAFAPS